MTPDTELIGDFRILGLLGSGGFANTYLAMDLTLGREVAIKEFFPSELAVRADSKSVSVKSEAHASQFEWARGRFVREAKTLAKFRHPSVVRVFRVFNANNTAYMVLEFVHGSNMEAWLKKRNGPPTQEDLDILLPPLLDALEVVHKAGILHRDIKPANIYIREGDHQPVLLDFGAAKYATAADNANTTAAIVSKGYSPNEAYSTDARLQGPWTDIYGLAATVYRALNGTAPPESTSRILNDECILTSDNVDLQDKYRPEFLAAIDGALEVIPKQRPQSIGQWRKQLFPNIDDLAPSLSPRSGTASDQASEPEWHPLSDSPSDVDTIYSQSLGKSGGSQGPSGGTLGERLAGQPSSGSQPSADQPGPSGSQAPPAEPAARQPSEIEVRSDSNPGSISVSAASQPTPEISAAGQLQAGQPSAPQGEKQKSAAAPAAGLTKTVLHTAKSLGHEANRTFYLGLFMLGAGGVALGSHLLMNQADPAPEANQSTPGFEQVAALNPAKSNEKSREAAAVIEADKARKAKEAEEARLAKERAEEAELARKAEEDRKAEEAEQARIAEERAAAAAEKRRLEEAAEQARLDREATERAHAAAQARRRAAEEEKERQQRLERQSKEQRLAREAAEKRRKADEERRLAEQRAAEAERARKEQEERERLAREAEEERRLAQERAQERARKRAEERAAEQRRLAEAERARKEQEERDRLAREAAEQERRLAEERRQAEQRRLAQERRRKEREAAKQRERDEAERARLAEQRRLEEEFAREQAELEAAAIAHNSEFQVAALQQNAAIPDADQRQSYLTQMQTLLKERSCYEGSVNGSIEDTQSAVDKLGENKKLNAPEIQLASATRGEYEDWLSWLRPQGNSLCAAPTVRKKLPKTKFRPVPRKRKVLPKKRTTPKKRVKPRKKKRKVLPKKKKRKVYKKKRPKKTRRKAKRKSKPKRSRKSSSSSSSGSSLLRGGR
ncbi:MAG: protein kinase [Alphaproteobacteria bacterium]|nr:protein kinase [Alphaproteobacteria bacterium]